MLYFPVLFLASESLLAFWALNWYVAYYDSLGEIVFIYDLTGEMGSELSLVA